MSTNVEHALPAPVPLCAIYEPLLPLYVWDELDAAQMEAIRTHLETDAYCQHQLAQFRTAIDALRAHVAADDGSAPELAAQSNRHATGGEAPIHLTLEKIMQASEKPSPSAATAARPTPRRQLTPRQRRLTALGAIAAVLVLAVLAASLFGYLGGRTTSVTTPTPTVRPTATPVSWPTAAPSTLTGVVREFNVPTRGANPNFIVAGPDGNLWFTEDHANKIGRSTPQGTITEFTVPTTNAGLTAIAAGPDGNLWFTESSANRIGKITPQGSITEFGVPTTSSQPAYLTAGPDGNVWFTEEAGNKIGTITPQGTITEHTIPSPNSRPQGITAGKDGNVWFAEYNTTTIARITPQGTIKEFSGFSSDQNATFSLLLPGQPVLPAAAAGGVWWSMGQASAAVVSDAGQVFWPLTPSFYSAFNHPPLSPPPACTVDSQGNEWNGNFFTAPDGAMWYSDGCWIIRQTEKPDGFTPYGTSSFQAFTGPSPINPNAAPSLGELIFAPLSNGTVWFVGQSTDQIGRLT